MSLCKDSALDHKKCHRNGLVRSK